MAAPRPLESSADFRPFFESVRCGPYLGLYAEEISLTGEALENFPQAFTHLGLISAAFNIDRALDGKLRGAEHGRPADAF